MMYFRRYKKYIGIAILCFLLLSSFVFTIALKKRQTTTNKAAENTSVAPKQEYAPGEVLVKFKTPLENIKTKSGKVIDFDKETATVTDLDQSSFPPVIQQQKSTEFKNTSIITIEKVFKGTGDPQTELSKFKTKFATEISQGKRKINETELLKIDLSRTYKLTFDKNQDALALSKTLSKNSDVEYAEPNYTYTVDSDPNDPYFQDSYPNNTGNRDPNWNPPFDYQWNIKKTNSESNWQTDTSSIIVAVIDSGVDVAHPELGNVWVNTAEIPGDGIDNDGNGCIDDINGCNTVSSNGNTSDDNNHGTHVAGVISAKTNNTFGIAGITNNTQIMAVKAMNASGYGSESAIAQGVSYASNNGARVLNMSIGGNYSSTIKDALDATTNIGVIPVVSAGNGNNYSMSSFPASYKKAITVGAIDEDNSKLMYSNYGPNIDVVAPGGSKDCWYQTKPGYCSNILSLKSSQNTNGQEFVVGGRYLRMSGTSMATPHVAGVVALLLSQHPTFTIDDVRNYIRFNSTNPQGNIQTEGMGWGVIDSKGTDFIPPSNIDFEVNYPSDNSYVGNRFNVEGVVKVDNFSRFDVVYRPQGMVEWSSNGVTLINSGNAPVAPPTNRDLIKIAEITLPNNAPLGTYEVKTTLYMSNGKNISNIKTILYQRKSGSTWYYQATSNDAPEGGDIFVDDINNDNDVEIVESGWTGVRVYDKNRSIIWQVPANPNQVVIGNLDRRTPEKEVIIQTPTAVYVYSSSGHLVSDMTLNVRSDLVYTIGNLLIATADSNGGDELCFYVDNYRRYSLNCYEQNGSGQLTGKWSIPSTLHSSQGPFTGDVNADGVQEIIAYISGKLTIVSLSGQIIAQSDTSTSASNLGCVLLGDINNDQKAEIIGCSNNGTSAYAVNNNSLVQVWNNSNINASPVALADFNNDGYIDIYLFNNTTTRWEAILNHDGSVLYSDNSLLYSSFNTPNIALGDRDGNGKTEVYFSGQRNIDGRSYLLIREYDYVTNTFKFIDGSWKANLPECGDSLTYGCNSLYNIKLALTDLEKNGKLDLVLAGVGIIEYSTSGRSFWPYKYHDYQRTNSYNFVPAETPSPIPTHPTAVIPFNGKVVFEGRGTTGTRWEEDITFKVYASGKTTPFHTSIATTSSTGAFDVNPDFPIIPDAYDFMVKGKHSLSRKVPDYITWDRAISFSEINFGTLLEGDINGDDLINSTDLNILQSTISSKTEVAYNPQADLNVDGVVNNLDLVLLLANFCKKGDGYVGIPPACSTPTRTPTKVACYMDGSKCTLGTQCCSGYCAVKVKSGSAATSSKVCQKKIGLQ